MYLIFERCERFNHYDNFIQSKMSQNLCHIPNATSKKHSLLTLIFYIIELHFAVNISGFINKYFAMVIIFHVIFCY